MRSAPLLVCLGDCFGGRLISQNPKCDTVGCGMEHTDSNHWWVVRIMDKHWQLWKWEDAVTKPWFASSSHFCGQTHALQFISSEMGK